VVPKEIFAEIVMLVKEVMKTFVKNMKVYMIPILVDMLLIFNYPLK